MIIESIKINAFGRLRDFSCEFSEGLNIVEGNNESGKSTLAAFIRYMLYGFPRAGSSELGEKRKRINWQEACASGSMVVRVGGKRYRIERSTVASTGAGGRESYREVGSVIDLETNTAVLGGTMPGEGFLGVPENIFENTAFIGQVGTPRVGSDLAAAIENLLFSGDESLNAKRALEKLDTLRRVLLYKNGKGGEIYDLEGAERELAERLAAAQEENARILSEEAELEGIRRRLDEVMRELAAATAEERTARYVALAAGFAQLHEAERELAEAQAALQNMEGMPAYLLQDEDLAELRVRAANAREATDRVATATALRERAEEGEVAEAEARAYLEQSEREGGREALLTRQRGARRNLLTGGILAIIAVLLGVGAGIFALVSPGSFAGSLVFLFAGAWAISALVLGTGIFLAAPAFFRLRALYAAYNVRNAAEFDARMSAVSEVGEALASRRNEITAARATEAAQTVEYNRALAELDTVVRRFGSRLPDTDIFAFVDTLQSDAALVLSRKKGFEETRVSRNAIITQLRGYLGDHSEADILAALPPEDKRPRLEDVRPEELQGRILFFRDQERELENHRRECENRLSALRARAESPAALTTELEAVRRNLAAAREQYEACILAYDAISGAGERLRRDVSPRLGNFTGRMMSHLTAGRYETVGVSQDLAVEVDMGDATRTLEFLSAGTQDLAYLSLRMALIDLLYREERPPVCFDESFAHQDDTRAARMMEVLLILSREGQQNILFTCHSREYDIATKLAGDVKRITLTA